MQQEIISINNHDGVVAAGFECIAQMQPAPPLLEKNKRGVAASFECIEQMQLSGHHMMDPALVVAVSFECIAQMQLRRNGGLG